MTYPSSPPVWRPETQPVVAPPGWHPDPYGAAALRYWDGRTWTAAVAHPTVPGVATAGRPWAEGPPPTLGAGAAPMMIAAVIGLWFAIRYSIRPVAGLIGGPGAIAYEYILLFGGMALVAVVASHQFGTGDVRRDLGLRIKPLDLVVFFVGGIGLWIIEIVFGVLIKVVGVPMRSNGSIVNQLLHERPGEFAVVTFAAIVGAPIFEEICFRGVIQRSLNSRMAPAAAIVATSLLFGLYHYTPQFGWGNVGMMIILAAAGMVLGTLAHWTGRLGPSMMAHAGLNTIVTSLIWLTATHLH